MKREEIENIYDQGKEAVVELVQGLIAEFTAKIAELTNRIDELEKQLGKDSHNSSKPPSTDNIFKKNKKMTRSMRKRSKKKSGGQEGHEGKTLSMTDKPDKRVRLKVKRCNSCGESLEGSSPKGIDRRQEIEIPKIKPYVTEYQSEIIDCPC
ncbi:MAG: IS66 family transposase zinc-finger binding domain-containing protein [Clostridiales bacterium]|nr:IS66 family transposase zinc-finger binding domain-containing protein [Clostridiales bacterium]